MTEHAIRGQVALLAAAIAKSDEGAGLTAGLALLAQALVDLNRVAVALEQLAKDMRH